MNEFFPNIPVVKYEGKGSKNPFAFKFYNPDEVIAGKTMREHCKFALAWWHALTAGGTDMFGSIPVYDRSFGGSDPMEIAKNRVYAGFEIMNKLGIDYFCFHDRDIAPEADTLAETNARLDEISEVIAEQMKLHNKKNLWGTANCFGNPRYTNGAGTNPNADVFAFAAAQIKKAIELTVKFGGTGYVFWGGREGYETLLNTDMGLELENMARLMTLARDYARSIGFEGDFYVEPKPKEPTKHQYDFDTATVIGFLRQHGLDKDFKINIEQNHAVLAGHTFQHELATARINGMFGSIDANQGDDLLGWDTDQFPTNVYEATLCMLEVLRAGGFTNGGLNFDAKLRRGSCTFEDIFLGFIAGMDTYALGLRIAAKIIEDGRIDEFVAERYSSWNEGIGAKIRAGEVTLADLETYALEKGAVSTTTARQERLESIINEIMFNL